MLIKLNINIEELKKVKNEIFNKKIDEKEKNEIIEKIQKEINEIIKDFEEKKDNEINE